MRRLDMNASTLADDGAPGQIGARTPRGTTVVPAQQGESTMREVRLVDLEIIKRYSLAIRQETAPADDLLAVLDATREHVAALAGSDAVEAAKKAPKEPAKSPGKPAAKRAPRRSAAS